MSEILRAKEAFTAPGPTDVAKGDLFNSDDPIVAGREHLFAPVAAEVRASVPTAPVSPPPFMVGESGREEFEPAADGKVISAPDMRRGGKAAKS